MLTEQRASYVQSPVMSLATACAILCWDFSKSVQDSPQRRLCLLYIHYTCKVGVHWDKMVSATSLIFAVSAGSLAACVSLVCAA